VTSDTLEAAFSSGGALRRARLDDRDPEPARIVPFLTWFHFSIVATFAWTVWLFLTAVAAEVFFRIFVVDDQRDDSLRSLLETSDGSDIARAGVATLLFSAALGLFMTYRFLTYRERLAIGEWAYLFEGAADRAPALFAALRGRLDERRPGAVTMTVGAPRFHGAARPYIELAYGNYAAYVTVCPQQNDCYVAWSGWRFVTPLRAFWEVIRPYIFRSDSYMPALEFDAARALRDLVRETTRGVVASELSRAPAEDLARRPTVAVASAGAATGSAAGHDGAAAAQPSRRPCPVCGEPTEDARLAPVPGSDPVVRACPRCVAAASL